ncbi:MAG: DUF2267 domain-containing protein [Actinobacteria bacterium]|nr:DUF2267 domain-containing protein [Actinomycetota bacterium]
MEELVKLVTEKTWISDDMARKAVQVVLGFLKDKLPAPIAGQIDGQIDGLISGGAGGAGGAAGGAMDSVTKGLGGLLGKD